MLLIKKIQIPPKKEHPQSFNDKVANKHMPIIKLVKIVF